MRLGMSWPAGHGRQWISMGFWGWLLIGPFLLTIWLMYWMVVLTVMLYVWLFRGMLLAGRATVRLARERRAARVYVMPPRNERMHISDRR